MCVYRSNKNMFKPKQVHLRKLLASVNFLHYYPGKQRYPLVTSPEDNITCQGNSANVILHVAYAKPIKILTCLLNINEL